MVGQYGDTSIEVDIDAANGTRLAYILVWISPLSPWNGGKELGDNP